MATLPRTMKAVQWTTTVGGIEKNLKVVSTAQLPKNARQLPQNSTLIKVAYTALNPADYKLPETPMLRSLMFSKPATPCTDFSGTVVSSTLPHLKPGQRVFGVSPPPSFGALSEYLLVKGKEAVVPLPNGLSLQDSAAIGVAGAAAYQTIVPFVKPGSKVFINGGSGGVGTFAIQIAKAVGCTVTATCSGANVELCKILGADHIIDYRSTDVVEHLKRQGTQYDLLTDYVGTPDIYWNAHHYLKPEGLFVTIAGNPTLADMRSLMAMFLLPRWLGGGQRTPKFAVLDFKAEEYLQITKWMLEGKVKSVIQQTYELEDVKEAFTQLKTGRTRGKLVVRVSGE